jgi:hypothetical protein
MVVAFDGNATPHGVNALCGFAGWSRYDLAERLGIGEPVLKYYERDGEPRWLVHALIGIAVADLGLSGENARELLGVSTDSEAR